MLDEENYDWALSIAYNAMLQAGRALMFLKGFRPSTQFGHIAVLRYLRATFKEQLTERIVDVFDQMRRKRHRAVYEAVDVVSRNEAQNALKWANEFREQSQRSSPNARKLTSLPDKQKNGEVW